MEEETLWQQIKLAKERLEEKPCGANPNHRSTKFSVHFIEKVPGNFLRGLGWVKLKPEIANKLQIPLKYNIFLIPNPEPYCCPLAPEDKSVWLSPPYQPFYSAEWPKYTGRSDKFTLNIKGENVTLYVQPSLTISALRAWLLTWVPEGTQLITPRKKVIFLTEDVKTTISFIYFIFNRDSEAIKIGRATDVQKRLKSLQTSSPVPLEVLKVVAVESLKRAKEIESYLHAKFANLRLSGEWFKADPLLKDYIASCDESLLKKSSVIKSAGKR